MGSNAGFERTGKQNAGCGIAVARVPQSAAQSVKDAFVLDRNQIEARIRGPWNACQAKMNPQVNIVSRTAKNDGALALLEKTVETVRIGYPSAEQSSAFGCAENRNGFERVIHRQDFQPIAQAACQRQRSVQEFEKRDGIGGQRGSGHVLSFGEPDFDRPPVIRFSRTLLFHTYLNRR